MSNALGSVAEDRQQRCLTTSWLVCLSAALFFFYEFIQMNMFSSINLALMEAFHITATELGTLSAIYFLANAIFLFVAGFLLDRFSTKRIITFSMLICIIGTFLFSQAHVMWVAQFSRFLTGIGSAFCFLCCIRLVTRWFPENMLAFATGTIVTLGMMGGVIAQVPTAYLVETFGWRQALLMDAVLGLLIMGLILLVVQDHPNDSLGLVEADTEALKQIGFWRAISHSLINAHNWLVGIITSLLNVTPIYLLGGMWGSFYLEQIHGMTPTQATSVTQMVFWGTILGSPLVGYLSDKIRLRREPLLVGTLLAMLTLMPIIFLNDASVFTMMALFFLLGLVTSVQILGYPLVAENNPSSLTATSVSVVSIATITGGVLFQPFFGWVMDNNWDGLVEKGIHIYNLHAFREAMLVMPVGFIVSFIGILLVKETFCHQIHDGAVD